MSVDRQGHIVELQSIRGLAALAVVVGHALNFYALPLWFSQDARIFNGRAAVVMFFVLSGFVLTRASRSAELSPMALARFYVRRFARIYPAIWVVSTLSLAYLLFLHWRVPIPHTSEFFQSRFRPDRMDALHIAASYAAGLAFLIPQLWSIFVELLGSMAIPFIAFAAYRNRKAFYIALVATLAASYVIGPYVYYHVALYGVDFLIGAWIAIFGPAAQARLRALKPAAPALLAVLCVCLLLTQFVPTFYFDPTIQLVEAALAAAMISLIVYSGVRVSLLQSRAALFLGDVSYSVYLIHFLVLCLLGKALGVAEVSLGIEPVLIPQAILLAVLTVIVTIPLSAVSYRWVEMPGIEVGKWLSRHLTAPRPSIEFSAQQTSPAPAREPTREPLTGG
jgi:peptidoglycan/LPS O-acetylase OafA/YrhL